MSIWAAVGATCLGMVMGWLVVYSLRRIEKVTTATLSAIVSVILGGAVSKFLDFEPSALSFYPIGLVIGFFVYIATLPLRSKLTSPQESRAPGAESMPATSDMGHDALQSSVTGIDARVQVLEARIDALTTFVAQFLRSVPQEPDPSPTSFSSAGSAVLGQSVQDERQGLP